MHHNSDIKWPGGRIWWMVWGKPLDEGNRGRYTNRNISPIIKTADDDLCYYLLVYVPHRRETAVRLPWKIRQKIVKRGRKRRKPCTKRAEEDKWARRRFLNRKTAVSGLISAQGRPIIGDGHSRRRLASERRRELDGTNGRTNIWPSPNPIDRRPESTRDVRNILPEIEGEGKKTENRKTHNLLMLHGRR